MGEEHLNLDEPTSFEQEYRAYGKQTGHHYTCHFVQRYVDSRHGLIYLALECTCNLKDGTGES